MTAHSSSAAVSADPISVSVRSIHAMAAGDQADFDLLYHPRAVDRENPVQPPSSRVPGPAGFYSTALWLRAAFADLHYDIHHAFADGNLVVVNSTMNGATSPRGPSTPATARWTPSSRRRARPSR